MSKPLAYSQAYVMRTACVSSSSEFAIKFNVNYENVFFLLSSISQPYLLVITAMANRGLLDPAITAYEKLARSTTELQDPSLYEFGMRALCKALQSKGVLGKLLQVLYFMMEHAIKVCSLFVQTRSL